MLLMDVDGVLTDGRLYFVPGPDGKMVETKAFDSQDGIALRWLDSAGIKTGVISGRNSPAVVERAAQVKMTYVYQGYTEKIPIIEEILAESRLTPEEVAYMGDDLTDIVVFRRVGLSIAPANARAEVKQAAHLTVAGAGGSGAVRDAIEFILKAQQRWDDILKHYEVY